MTNKDKIIDIDDFQNSNTYNTSDDSDDSKFTDLYTKTMDNVTMSQENKDVIRAKIAEQSQTGRSGRKLIRIGKYSAIAAAVCAVLLCIPATRTTVSAAIDYIKQTFHLANGTEVTYEENSEGNCTLWVAHLNVVCVHLLDDAVGLGQNSGAGVARLFPRLTQPEDDIRYFISFLVF